MNNELASENISYRLFKNQRRANSVQLVQQEPAPRRYSYDRPNSGPIPNTPVIPGNVDPRQASRYADAKSPQEIGWREVLRPQEIGTQQNQVPQRPNSGYVTNHTTQNASNYPQASGHTGNSQQQGTGYSYTPQAMNTGNNAKVTLGISPKPQTKVSTDREFQKIFPSPNHTVLYDINQTSFLTPSRNATQQQISYMEFVKMPFMDDYQPGHQVSRWSIINSSLRRSMKSSHDLQQAILDYNPEHVNEWKFVALHSLFRDHLSTEETVLFFDNTLPLMVEMALDLPEIICNHIPLLKQGENKSISLSQLQIASLLANAFFCTFPLRNLESADFDVNRYPGINFYSLYLQDPSSRVIEKLKCILNYFKRVTESVPTGVVTFERCFVDEANCPNWSTSDKPIKSIPISVESYGSIENGDGLLQVNFANKFMGGDVLYDVLVQEEIRFVVHPELIASMLFTEVLGDTETMLIIGCEKYNDYTGYSDSFRWAGDFVDKTPRDSNGRIKCAVISIDALPFVDSYEQYQATKINRELNKAWVGFSAGTINDGHDLVYPGIATGNWGCGAFRGSPQLKFLLQLMACCQARRSITYFTFKDVTQKNEILNLYKELISNNTTIGTIYNFLIYWSDNLQPPSSPNRLFEDLSEAIKNQRPMRQTQKYY